MASYFRYISEQHSFVKRDPLKDLPETLREVVSYCAGALRPYFPRLIPVEAIMELAWVLFSVKRNRFVYEKEIERHLRADFKIYRDWRAGFGFVEAK